MSAQGDPGGLPTCDRCGRVVIWKEGFGWAHVTFEHPHGAILDKDGTGHAAVTVNWTATEYDL